MIDYELVIEQVIYEINIEQSGPRGGIGLSAYDVAIQKGFIGTEEQWLLSLKGKDGDIGIGFVITAKAGTVINKSMAVYLDSNNKVQYASNLDVIKSRRTIGITNNYGNTDEDINIQTHGELNDNSFNFDIDNIIYLSDNGNITQTYNANAKVCLIIGFAINQTTIFIDIKNIIIIN